MANIKISALPLASPITGLELVPIVQSTTTKKTTVNDIKAYILTGTGFISGSGTANKIPVFTGIGTVADSILTQNVNGKEVSLAVNTNSLIGISVINADNTNGSSRARLSAAAGTVQGGVLAIATAGVYLGTESNHRTTIMMNGTEYIGITTSGKVVVNQAADTGERFIVEGALRANGQITSTNVASAFRLLSGSDTLFSIGYTGGTLFDRLTGTSFFIAENGSPQFTINSGGSFSSRWSGAFYSAIDTGAKSTLGHASTQVNLVFGINGTGNLGSIIQSRDNVSAWYLSLNPFGGNVLVGNIPDTGEKFQVGGSVRISGISGEALKVFGVAGEWGASITGASTAGQSYGLLVAAGTNSSDFALNIFNQNLSSSLLNIKGNGVITIGVAPATSAASYDILTRNTVTGVVEKVPSSVLGISGSGAAGLIPVFTGATSIGNSIMSQSGSILLINGEVRIITVEEQPVGFYKTLVHDSTTNYVHEVAINSFERTPIADIDYTTSAQDNLIAYTALTAQRTVSLRPPATSLGTAARPVFVVVKDESGNANTHNIKVDVSGGGNIDGSPTQSISTSYGSIWFYCDGTKWSVYTRI